LAAEPVCRLRLPGVVPLGFHGTWQGTASPGPNAD
jgi:carotenoid cleavage dioxygenase-like enzyme